MFVRDHSEDDSPRKTAQGTDDADSPLRPAQRRHFQGRTTNKDDHDLTTDHDAIDTKKPVVLEHSFEDVEFVVKSPVVELVEYLHPHKGVEDYSVEFELFVGITEIVSKDLATSEE